MRKLLCTAFLAAVILSVGCAITDYPVITDTRGADANGVHVSFYDKALIIPSAQVATIWSDGSDELFTLVMQDWKGDQFLYTYNNFDPSGAINFLEHTYCDPTRQTNCALSTSWNPDNPGYPYGSGNEQDDIFDYIYDTSCSGARSLSLLVSYSSRPMGECGSGIWADRQAAAYEFSLLETVNFRGNEYYHMPIDNSVASFSLTGQDGSTGVMPVFGRFNGYLDEKLRMAFPMTPNARFQLRWIDNWVASHGNAVDVDLTYGSLNANFKLTVTTVQAALDRI